MPPPTQRWIGRNRFRVSEDQKGVTDRPRVATTVARVGWRPELRRRFNRKLVPEFRWLEHERDRRPVQPPDLRGRAELPNPRLAVTTTSTALPANQNDAQA